jgi:hypothetical protein
MVNTAQINPNYFRLDENLNLPGHLRHGSGPPFRFLDLPAELRLEIAEYVATYDQHLDWRLLLDNSWPLFECFLGLQQLNVLTQVCRQLRAETTGIVWKINPIHIYGMDIGDDFTCSSSLQCIEQAEALRHFLENVDKEVPVSIVEHIRTITLEVWLDQGDPELYGDWHPDVISLFRHMIKYTRELPQVRLRIYDQRWTSTESSTDDWWKPPCKDELEVSAKIFVEHGHYLEALLASNGYNDNQRTWRIFPGKPQRDLEFLELVDKDLVDKWYRKGF